MNAIARLLLCLALLFQPACVASHADTISPKAGPSEVWSISWEIEDAELGELPPLEVEMPVGGPLVRVVRSPAQRALDPAKVRDAALAKLRALLRLHNLPVVVNLSAEGRQIVHVRGRAEMPGLLGNAKRVDLLNMHDEEDVDVFLASLRDGLRYDPTRKVSEDPTIDEEDLGEALGILILHEMGHCWGLRHHVVEIEADLYLVMAQGMDKYTERRRAKVFFSPTNLIYLQVVMAPKDRQDRAKMLGYLPMPQKCLCPWGQHN